MRHPLTLLKRRLTRKKSGIALIMVLIMVVVLGLLAGKFAYEMKVETTLARRASYSSELDWMGRSGIEVAKWILIQSSTGPNAQVDSLKQKWAGGIGETNDILAGIDMKNFPIGNGFVSIDIKDMDRKFNINVASEVILRQAMTLIGVDASVGATVANSILDWRDADSNTHPGGTESSTYEAYDPPYFAKDGPIDDMSELLLINGVTPNLYWGSGGGSGPQIFNRTPGGSKSAFEEEPTYAVGLVELFTPVSSRLINVNTASANVLQLIPEIDANVAQAILTARAGQDGQDGTEDDLPFRSPQDVTRVPGFANPQAAAQLGNYFTVRSLCFEIHVTANVGGTKREYVAIVRRNNARDVPTLNLYWK